MTIHVPDQFHARNHKLAEKQGRGVDEIVEEAIREYLDVPAITDLSPADVAPTQEKLLGQLDFGKRGEARRVTPKLLGLMTTSSNDETR